MTLDASSYAPAPLSPAPQRIDAGEAMPARTDAVAAFDAVEMRGAEVFALAAVAPGEGVLPPNADTIAGLQLRLAGGRLRRIDVALLTTLGVERVLVREPRVRVVRASSGEIVRGAATFIASAIDGESGRAVTGDGTLEAALEDDSVDAVVAIGGTGSGRNDASVNTLARIGKVAFHGIGITPGETTALGFVGTRPVLLLPGRIDAALAGWLTVGRRMLARLAFRLIEEQPFAAELARKIASPLGLAEVVAVRRRLGKVEPVAAGYLSMQALAQAEGWILVPADSEGHAPGARVIVRPWP
jgi:molybdopterin biosynthesis enzyme